MEIKELFNQDDNTRPLEGRLDDLEVLLRDLLEKVEDNHRILRHEERSKNFKKFASVLKVAIIAGAILVVYFMARPHIVKIQEGYSSISANIEKFENTTSSIQENVEKAEGFFGSFSDDLKGATSLFDNLGKIGNKEN